jgi:hypothetical protein
MLAAEGTTSILVAAGLTAATRGQVEADRNIKNLGTSSADPVSSLKTHFWNSTNVPTGLIFIIQISLQQLSAPAAAILTHVFNHNSFHLTSHITHLTIHRHNQLASCWPIPISLHPKVPSVVFPGSVCFSVRSFSLRPETCYEAFCLHVDTNCLCNPVLCRNLPLCPTVYHLCTFYLLYT